MTTPLSKEKTWMLQQFFFEDVLHRLDSHFSLLQTWYMPIKGAHLILSGLAEKMKSRAMCDIDIMVLPNDMKKVSDYFFSCPECMPSTYYTECHRPYETSFKYLLKTGSVHVEIHSMLNFPERFTLHNEDLFARAIKKQGVLLMPAKEDALLIFLCHLFTHFPFEWRETNFEEIGLLIGDGGFNWGEFNERARKTGLRSFMYYVLKGYEKNTGQTIRTEKPTIYARLLFCTLPITASKKTPFFIKRLLFELPFINRPAALIKIHFPWHKRYTNN